MFVPYNPFKGSIEIFGLLVFKFGFLCCVFSRSQRKNVTRPFVLEFHFFISILRCFCVAVLDLCLFLCMAFVWIYCFLFRFGNWLMQTLIFQFILNINLSVFRFVIAAGDGKVGSA